MPRIGSRVDIYMNLPPVGPCTKGPRKFGGPSIWLLAMFTVKSKETFSPESEVGTRSYLPCCKKSGTPGGGLISVMRSGSERIIFDIFVVEIVMAGAFAPADSAASSAIRYTATLCFTKYHHTNETPEDSTGLIK